MKQIITIAASSALLLLAFSVQAEIITDSASGLQAWIPDNWIQSTDEGVLSVRDATGDARVTFVGLPAESIEAGTAAIDSVLAAYVDDATTTDPEPQEISHEDLRGVLATGTGVVDNRPVHWGVGAFLYGDHMLYVVVADMETFQYYQDDLSLIMLSIAPEAIEPPLMGHEIIPRPESP